MAEVRQLQDDEVAAFVAIVAHAYPAMGLHTAEDRQRYVERMLARAAEGDSHFYGAFQQETLVGGMVLHDFTMNVFGAQVPTGGVGMVAVDLPRKKEKAARDLVRFYLQHYRAQGAPLAALYPFRPDFYKQMGFGFGTKVDEYRVQPASLPRSHTKAHLAYLTPADAPALHACYARYQASTHGMMRRGEALYGRLLANDKLTVIGARRGDRVEGYLAFSFQPCSADNFVCNDLLVEEMVYESREALGELMAFLNSQSDQVRYVLLRTQEEDLHYLMHDPRTGDDAIIPYVVLAHVTNRQGLGIMYRVLDVAGVFRALSDHDFGGQTCRLRLSVADSFLPENARSVEVAIREGKAEVVEGGQSDVDVDIRLDVADFSSLLLGVVSFERLYRYGLAELSNLAWLDRVNRVFRADAKPMCITAF